MRPTEKKLEPFKDLLFLEKSKNEKITWKELSELLLIQGVQVNPMTLKDYYSSELRKKLKAEELEKQKEQEGAIQKGVTEFLKPKDYLILTEPLQDSDGAWLSSNIYYLPYPHPFKIEKGKAFFTINDGRTLIVSDLNDRDIPLFTGTDDGKYFVGLLGTGRRDFCVREEKDFYQNTNKSHEAHRWLQ